MSCSCIIYSLHQKATAIGTYHFHVEVLPEEIESGGVRSRFVNTERLQTYRDYYAVRA